jgi:hypothetical protein
MLESLDTLIAFVLIMLIVSMLITICVQMVSAAMNLRGKYLGQGLAHTFGTILPNMPKARKLACRILSGDLLSDSTLQQSATGTPVDDAEDDFRRCATAVRPDEVFDALHRIATGRTQHLADLKSEARDLLKGLGVSDVVLQRAEADAAAAMGKPLPVAVPVAVNTAQQIVTTAKEAIAQLAPADQEKINAAMKPVTDRLAELDAKAAQQVVDVAKALDDACRKFKYWFEVSQERAQQWFTTHTRWFTVFFAVLFAFALQLDTIEIFKFVSSNKAARDKLVAQVSAVTGEAEKIVGDAKSVLQDALNNWRNGLADDAAKQAVASVAVNASDTPGKLRRELKEKLGEKPGTEALLEDFDRAAGQAAQKKLDEGAQDFTALKSKLDDTGFKLFVTEEGGRWHHGWWTDLWPHLLGILFTVGLLSLGAPFWFNVLKSLSNLRSRVAENISTEQEGDKPAPGSTASPASTRTLVAPPTVMPPR